MSFVTHSLALDIFGVITALLAISIAYIKWKLTYWDRVGLPTLDPSVPFGDAKKWILAQYHIGEQFREFYQKFKAKGLRHGGVYVGIRPFYMPVDPEMVKHVLQTDFQHFVNRGIYINEEDDPLSANLFTMEDTKWRNLRIKLTPTFTSGKMKMMFQTMVDCTVGLNTIMDDAADRNAPVEIKDVLARFTTDIIASTAFGLDTSSLKDSNSLFRKYGDRIIQDTTWERLKTLIQLALPHSWLKTLKMKSTKPDVEQFFMKTVQDTVSYRENNKIYRKDFLHLLLQLKNRGLVADDDKIVDEDGKIQEKELTMNELTAQVLLFFLAGFETSSSTMNFALYEIAVNPDIQDKLRDEINRVLSKYDDQVTYNGVMEMTYMEKVLNETLRKYPPVSLITRKCTKNYTIPNTSIHLKKGVDVAIPVWGLHLDSEYYPNPEIFDPERFSEDNKRTRPPYTWLPFGEGPRVCIGLRFGMLQSKVGLVALLKNYRISLNKKTKTPFAYDKNSLFIAVEGGTWLNVEKIN